MLSQDQARSEELTVRLRIDSDIQRGGTGCTQCAHLRMPSLIRHEVAITRTKNTYRELRETFNLKETEPNSG